MLGVRTCDHCVQWGKADSLSYVAELLNIEPSPRTARRVQWVVMQARAGPMLQNGVIACTVRAGQPVFYYYGTHIHVVPSTFPIPDSFCHSYLR